MRTVHSYIRAVLKEHKCLRREEIYHEVAKRFNHYEGDIGRRCREMGDVICAKNEKITVVVNGRKVHPYLYRLIKIEKAAA